ncbi:PREDICTED: serine-rich adhesin for platelets isoform X1 [Polistes canadensis]|uniref:serine-rich adhesin for platelets isoform X1 n=1 Tax=Polistes canadensis TaxID=91411 RepID=UPI000718F625|nr:PREDICTED: serine-rich adhesin for platelets isoform X1 [Polistes canadensis]
MSEGADSSTRICENSLTTLNTEDKPNVPLSTESTGTTTRTTKETTKETTTSTTTITTTTAKTTTSSYTPRRPRFGTGNVPLSPYIWIDGRQIRSALAYTKKWPPRRVSFPTNDMNLVTGYLEPPNPWRHAENVNREDLIKAYKESCQRHNTEPLEKVLAQLESWDLSEERNNEFKLNGINLDLNNSETLEEILKRIQFKKIDLEATSLNDETSVILFDMLEYYESAKHLNISSNSDIGARGWQACSHMIKKTQCLEQLEAKDVTLNEQYMTILSRALRLVYHLHVLKLENCGLSGRPIATLVTALKMNTGIRELYLADNGLDFYDAIQLGSLLRLNNHLQLLDISNNNIQDDGVHDLLEGLINQVQEDKEGKGLSILILWNNRLTKKSSPYFSRIISLSRTLETLNIGQNMLTSEMLITVKDSLKQNRILLQLGMQSTDLTCNGIIALSDVIENNKVLQRIDLRDNSIQMTGMKALSTAMQKNKSVVQLDLDDKPRIKIDGTLHQYMDVLEEVRSYCARNKENQQLNENTGDSESPRHHSRFFSASSRKISLTCQTLPCSPSPMTSVTTEDTGRSTLEPKRTSGGRLRSPAPSPIPSPVASPIPSPSRSRFVVSRVSEASLRSTDSSTSSSPVTPTSLGPMSTCFFPSTSGTSRFRVSLVESSSSSSSSCTSTPKSVFASSKSNVTIGFNFKIDSVESADSDDSDNIFKSETETNKETINKHDAQEIAINSEISTISINNNNKHDSIQPLNISDNINEQSTNECFTASNNSSEVNTQDNLNLYTVEHKEDSKDNQSDSLKEETIIDTSELIFKKTDYYKSEIVQDAQIDLKDNIDKTSVNNEKVDLIDLSNEEPNMQQSVEDILSAKSQVPLLENKTAPPIQKHTSGLEKLPSLFQSKGNFFSESSNISQTDFRNLLQGSVNSVLSFGDKFHQYFKDGKAICKSNASGTFADIISLPTKSKPLKSLNVTQLPSIQTLTNMFASFKTETTNTNASEQQSSKKCSNQITKHPDQGYNEEKVKEKNLKEKPLHNTSVESSSYDSKNFLSSDKEDEASISSLNIQTLPDNVQLKDEGHASRDLIAEENNSVTLNVVVKACSKTVHNASSINVPESKMTVCIPKLKDIPEYSVLEVSENVLEKETIEYESVRNIDSVKIEKVCDRSLTDSINLTSDEISSSCNVTCDIKVIDNVNIVSMLDESVNLQTTYEKDVAESLLLNTCCKNDKVASNVHVDDYNNHGVNDISMINHNLLEINVEKKKNFTNEVTKTCSVNVNEENEKWIDLNDSLSQDIGANTCHVDIDPHSKSTTVNSKIKSCISELSLTSKDNVEDFNNVNAQIHPTASICTEEEEDAVVDLWEEDKLNDLITEETLLSKPNNVDACPIVSKDVKVNNYIENNINKPSGKESDFTILPTVILSQTKDNVSASVKKTLQDFEKSDSEDLIFCITDISNYGNSIKDEGTLSPSIVSDAWQQNDNAPEIETSFFDLPQTSHSSTTLIIEKPENIHRNSQDSGIEESNLLSTSEDNIPEVIQPQHKESFQESVDSGIETECSLVCVKVNPSTDDTTKTEITKNKSSNNVDDNAECPPCKRINDLTDFQSDIIEQIQPRKNDTVSEVDYSYLDMVKCAVVTSTCSIGGIEITNNTAVGTNSEEDDRIVAEPPVVFHVTSPK